MLQKVLKLTYTADRNLPSISVLKLIHVFSCLFRDWIPSHRLCSSHYSQGLEKQQYSSWQTNESKGFRFWSFKTCSRWSLSRVKHSSGHCRLSGSRVRLFSVLLKIWCSSHDQVKHHFCCFKCMLLLLLTCHLSMKWVPLFAFWWNFYFFLLTSSRPGMGGGFEARSATEPQGGWGSNSLVLLRHKALGWWNFLLITHLCDLWQESILINRQLNE